MIEMGDFRVGKGLTKKSLTVFSRLLNTSRDYIGHEPNFLGDCASWRFRPNLIESPVLSG